MRTRKGVTLIELLIVVLILGALAAIAIPKISQSSANARAATCRTNLDTINSQIELYAANHDGTYPDITIIRDPNYFPDGEPKCPSGGTYSLAVQAPDVQRAVCSLSGATPAHSTN